MAYRVCVCVCLTGQRGGARGVCVRKNFFRLEYWYIVTASFPCQDERAADLRARSARQKMPSNTPTAVMPETGGTQRTQSPMVTGGSVVALK